MKKEIIVTPILVMLLLINLNSFAQKKKKGKEQLATPTFTMDAGKVVYTGVVEQSGVSAKDLYGLLAKPG